MASAVPDEAPDTPRICSREKSLLQASNIHLKFKLTMGCTDEFEFRPLSRTRTGSTHGNVRILPSAGAGITFGIGKSTVRATPTPGITNIRLNA